MEQAAKAESGNLFQDWQSSLLQQEKDYMEEKMEEAKSDYDLKEFQANERLEKGEIDEKMFKREVAKAKLKIDFFYEKIKRVDHDLYIQNKSKFDLIKFYEIA